MNVVLVQPCPPHQWAFAPTVGNYQCMKCTERRDYNDSQYAEAEREYQAQVRNMQQSSDMVARVARVVEDAPFDAWSIAEAALEACHHAELVEALDPFARVARLSDAAGLNSPDERPCRDFFPGIWPTLGDCRRAAAVLAKICGDA